METIDNINPISYIIQQEEKYQDVITYNPEYEAANNLIQTSQLWDSFRASAMINEEPNYDSFSVTHAAYLLIPFYIARWHQSIRDSTRVYHLKPALVYITAFCDQMQFLKICTLKTTPITVSRNEIVSQLNPQNPENNKTLITELLQKSFFECQEFRDTINKELDECLRDPSRAGLLQDISIAADSQLVFAPIVNQRNNENMEDLEDLALSLGERNADDIEAQIARSEQSDFKNACDLLGDFVADEERNIVIDDPLSFEPEDVGDFNALHERVKEEYENLNPDERLLFAKSFLSKATQNLPSYVIKDIADSITIPK